MAAAISCSNCNGYYNYNGKKYSFIETTGNWRIGHVPPDYRNTYATILETPVVASHKRKEEYAFNRIEEATTFKGTDSENNSSKNKTKTITINGVTYNVPATGTTIITVTGNTLTITNKSF